MTLPFENDTRRIIHGLGKADLKTHSSFSSPFSQPAAGAAKKKRSKPSPGAPSACRKVWNTAVWATVCVPFRRIPCGWWCTSTANASVAPHRQVSGRKESGNFSRRATWLSSTMSARRIFRRCRHCWSEPGCPLPCSSTRKAICCTKTTFPRASLPCTLFYWTGKEGSFSTAIRWTILSSTDATGMPSAGSLPTGNSPACPGIHSARRNGFGFPFLIFEVPSTSG